MDERSSTMRRADRRSLLLLLIAIAPIVLVVIFSLNRWNANGGELAAAESATGPVSSMYSAYSFVNVMARAESTLIAASLPDASAEVRALAETESARFEPRLNAAKRDFEALIPELAGSLGQSSEQTLELLEFAGTTAGQALEAHHIGDPVPAVLSFIVEPARDQLITVVAPIVSTSVPELQDSQQILIELLRLDAAYDNDLKHLLNGRQIKPGDLEVDTLRRVRWDEQQQRWTLALGELSGEASIAQLDAGSVVQRDGPVMSALVSLAQLDRNAPSEARNELILAALESDAELGETIHDAHESLLAQATALRNDLQRSHSTAAIGGLLMTVLGLALFGLIVGEIRDRRRVARAHDQALHEMAELANRDSLTGLRNRRWLDIELPRALGRRTAGDEIGIVYVDVDRFKGINDVWGHQIGDVILRVVAQRMQKSADDIHDLDLVRFGGDEFVGLVRMRGRSGDAALDDVGAKLLAAFREPITYEGKVHHVDCSIGLTLSTPESTPHSLLVEADLSLLEAKRSGRGRAVVYQRVGSQVGELVQALPSALADGEFAMHLQPVINVESGDIVHYEALARWTRPSGEVVSPAVFVPLIEAFGLANDLTRAMLVNVGDLLLRSPAPLPRIWINVSPVEFNGPDLSGRLLSILDELRIEPECVGIEMTERSAIGDLVGVEDELQLLRDRGIEIAIDDFGAGYSPLGHLRDLPVDVLKIDRSLIADIDSDHGAQMIVRGIIGFARTLGMSLIAEGVERDEELAFLHAEGIDMVQGHLTGRPAAPELTADQAPARSGK